MVTKEEENLHCTVLMCSLRNYYNNVCNIIFMVRAGSMRILFDFFVFERNYACTVLIFCLSECPFWHYKKLNKTFWDWVLYYSWAQVSSCNRLQFLLSQFLSGGFLLYGVMGPCLVSVKKDPGSYQPGEAVVAWNGFRFADPVKSCMSDGYFDFHLFVVLSCIFDCATLILDLIHLL